MNDNNMNDRYYPGREDYESEIDLVNLLGHILIKWKLIVIVAIVCAIIGGVFGYVRSGKNDDTNDGGEENTVAAAAAKLTEAQKAEAEEYYDQLVAYDRAIDEQKTLNSEAYIMSLDPYSAAGCNLWYMLETDMGNASSVYSDILNDEDYRKISDALGSNINRRYLKDVITFGYDETMDAYKLNFSNTDRKVGDIRNEYKLMLKVTITAPDRNSCDKIAQITDEAVERETEALQNYGVAIKCTKFTLRTYDADVTERIIAAKQKKVNDLGNLETNKGYFYSNVIARTAVDEKAYIDALYSEIPDTGSDIAEKVPAENKVSKKTILKYMIVVAFAGVLVAACMIAVIYIFGGKLHVPNEINGMGIPILQCLSASKGITGNDIITKWGSRLMGEDQGSPDNFAILMEEVEKKTEQGIKSVYIAIDKSSATALEYGQRIINEASGGIAYYIGGILPDAGDMKELLGSDAVLILPVIECTKTKSISVFADICMRNRIGIIGSVPVR